MKRIASFFIATCIVGCAHKTEFPKYSTLVGQGILPLSTSDAYLGANLFVADEASHSTQLFNFLAGRGGPTAIELDEEGSGPPHMLMFYPRDKEVFAAELVQMPTENGGTYREWLVRGPYAIERKDFKELAHLESAFAGEPLFMIEGHAQRFRFQQPETVPSQGFKTVLVPVLPTPKPTPTPKKSIKVITVKKDDKPTIEEYKPVNSDQQAIRMSQGFAERAQDGDVIHTITAENESLETISKWYTGSVANATLIAAVSQIAPGTLPGPGARIKIPAKLLKNDKLMPYGYK